MNEVTIVQNKPLTASEIIGNRYGRLTVVSFSHINKYRSKCYVCRCDCGNIKVINRNDLRSGRTLSCGCYKAERSSETHSGQGNSHYIDGRGATKLYRLWHGMIERCEDPKHISFKYYGGKGIAICDEWRADFNAFRQWAVVNGYKEGLSIDRKNTSENYSPGNCEWVTRSENTARGNRGRFKHERA